MLKLNYLDTMDLALFTSVSLIAIWHQLNKKKNIDDDDQDNHEVFRVDNKNRPLQSSTETPWQRSTFILVMHEPPHMFYEPKEWSNTTCLLLETEQAGPEHGKPILSLPGGVVYSKESYEQAAIRSLRRQHNIDVCSPQNCLHHLFTFPLEFKQGQSEKLGGVWGDFYECVSRGPLPYADNSTHNGKDDVNKSLSAFSLAQLKELTEHSPDRFSLETLYALKLYFQRQGDLRAKRRLLKGYSSADLEAYGLRSNSSLEKLVLTDMKDTQRQHAIDYTMKTDDGMSPNLLWKADVVLLGVSRAGKTPLSIFLATQMGLKVANIPLVMELPPPIQLEKVNPRKVFCLTLQPDYLMNFRQSRFRREMKKHVGQKCSYADINYVKRDVESARALARSKGYTEIDVTGRAMEETSSMIVSKIQERFPELHVI